MRKYALALAVVIAIGGMLGTQSASADVWMPGSWGLGDDWNPDSNDFTDDGGGLWSNTLTGLTAGNRYEFKIVEDADANGIGEWANDLIIPGGNNAVVYADGSGEITVNYDANTQRYLVSNFQTVNPWYAVGDWQDEAGAASDWDNSAAETQMTDLGGGIYQYVSPTIAAGTYQWKATTNGWDFQVGDEGVNANGATQEFTLDGNQFVTMTMDSNTQQISFIVTSVPEPGAMSLLAVVGLVAVARRRR